MIGAGRNGSAVVRAGELDGCHRGLGMDAVARPDRAREDLSFMLFTIWGSAATVDDDKDGEIVIPGDWPTEDEKK
jgi:hypothetical protein